jgi:hypothetical protein
MMRTMSPNSVILRELAEEEEELQDVSRTRERLVESWQVGKSWGWCNEQARAEREAWTIWIAATHERIATTKKVLAVDRRVDAGKWEELREYWIWVKTLETTARETWANALNNLEERVEERPSFAGYWFLLVAVIVVLVVSLT